MTTNGYEVEAAELDAVVHNVLADILGGAAELGDPIVRYHELTRAQRLWEVAGQRIVRALTAERGHTLRQTGMTQAALREPTSLGTQQRVSQIMAAGDHRDPVVVELGDER